MLPGSWRVDPDRRTRYEPPSGDFLDIHVCYDSEEGETIQESIRAWVRNASGNQDFPNSPWVFAGSRFEPNPAWMEQPGEHYVADLTGSIVGLVTFGDETVGFFEVIADASRC